jgi:hypothetical protein
MTLFAFFWHDQPRRKKPLTGRNRSLLSLEVLEDRFLPSVTVWTGKDDINGNSNWSDPVNWSNGVPGASDTAEFTNGPTVDSTTSVMDQSFHIESLLIDMRYGGLLYLDAPLVLSGTSEWDSGIITLQSNGSLTNNGTLSESNGPGLYGNGTFTNNGTILQQGTNDWDVGGYDNGQGLVVTLDNTSTGVINLQSDSGIAGGNGIITNAGIIEKTGGTGASEIFESLNNTGTIDSESGTLGLEGANTAGPDGTDDTNGTFKTAAGAFIDLAEGGEMPFKQSGTFTAIGTGTILLDQGGTVNISPTGATFNIASTVTFSWIDAAINVPARTMLTCNGNLSVDGDSFASLGGGGTFIEHGMITVSSAQGLAVNGGTTLDIARGSILDFQSDSGIFINYGGTSPELLANAGTIEKTGGTGMSALDLPVANTGLVQAQSGTLAFGGATDTNGTFKTAAGAFIALTQAGTDFTENRTFTATGSGGILLDAGSLSVGTAGAIFNIASGVTFSWGDAYINTTPKAALTFNGGLSVDTTSGPTLDGGGKFVEHGTITVSGPRNIYINPGDKSPTTLVISSGSVLDFQSDCGVVGYSSPLLTDLSNAGTIEKTGGTGTSALDLPFANTGVVQVQSGTLQLTTGLSLNGTSVLRSSAAGMLSVPGNLLGNTHNARGFTPLGTVLLTGSGPQLLEVMSQDRGKKAAGFARNFAYGTLAVAQNSQIQLVDHSRNSPGTGHEALYVDTLIVHGTLDLNHLHVYARTVQIDGQVMNGKVSLVP